MDLILFSWAVLRFQVQDSKGYWSSAFDTSIVVHINFRSQSLLRILHRWGWLGFVALAVSFAALPLFRDGLTHGYDIQYHMNRLYQYQQQFFAGQLYPRWLEGSYAGYGTPTFIFYPPMFVWAALPFSALGFSLSQQLIGSCVLAWVVATTGAYGYVRLWLPQSRIAWLSAILFICCSPYFLFNIYFRGAYAEAWAMAWLVWVLWGMLIVSKTQRLIYCLPLALATAMIALSHIPTLLLLGIFGLIAPWIVANSTETLSTVLKTYASLALGLLTAAFFLLPAVSLQYLANVGSMDFGGVGIASHRFIITDLLKFAPRFGDVDTFDKLVHIPFFLCLTTLIISTFIYFRKTIHPALLDTTQARQVLLLSIGLFLSVFMMTDLSLVAYYYLPTLEKIQFSWRWLALGSIFMSLLWSWLIFNLDTCVSDGATNDHCYVSIALLIVLSFFSVGYTLQHDRRDPGFIASLERNYAATEAFPYEELSYPLEDRLGFLLQDQAGRYAFRDGWEYLPLWAVNNSGYSATVLALPEAKPLVDVTDGEATVDDIEWQYGLRRFRVTAPEETELALRMFAWPSWQVRVGESLRRLHSQEHAHDPETGRLTLRVPAGEHWVEVKYVGSLAERWGWFWSGCGLMVVGGIVVWDRRQQRRLKQAEPPSAEVLN